MVLVALTCALVGNAGVFGVKIDDSAQIWELKDALKAKKINDLENVDADKLRLFLAKTGVTWLSSRSEDIKKLEKGEKTALIEALTEENLKLAAADSLKDVLEENHMTPPQSRQVHVLVELPPSTNILPKKRLRVEETMPLVEKFEDVPQINIQGAQYVTLPAAFLKKCGSNIPGDLMLYCRSQVRDLWNFVQNEVIVKNGRGYIVGPPGTGKSVSTLSYVASLDHEEWNVVWIHLSNCVDTCLSLGTKEYWEIDDLSRFELPRVAGKKLFICLDGFKATTAHDLFFKRVFAHLNKTNERLIVCSSMATLGKRNREDDRLANIQVFFMYSWTQDEYIAAIANQTFYDKILSKLDATSSNEVNEDDGFEEEWSEEDKKKHALDLKFYYAGGSCRFMFQYLTDEVMKVLTAGVRSAANKADLVKYCVGDLHTDAINRLYGMQCDGGGNARFPVSSYAASLFAKECGEETIAQLAARLNASNNPSVDGHLFEWLFLASVPKRAVKLFGDHGVEEVLPQANVLRFDPKKRFKVLRDGQIKGDQSWLQPTVWNQGGYDAVHFDKDEGKVIFVQVTRSDKHDFKMRFFYEVLYKLKCARMVIKQVVVYFVVKPAQYLNFKIDHIQDRDVLYEFDASWTRPEESHIRVRAYEAAPV